MAPEDKPEDDDNLESNSDVNYNKEFNEFIQKEFQKSLSREAEHSEVVMRFPLTASIKLKELVFPKGENKENLSLSADQLGEAILERVPIAKTPNNTLYFYKEGVYVPGGEQAIREIIIRLLHHGGMMKDWNAENVGLTLSYIHTVAPFLWEKPLDTRINLLNGIYDCVTMELLEHTHLYLSTVQLPINYDKDAVCLGMEKFVKEVFKEDSYHVAWEIMAWVITSSNEGQNMIILNGSGSNGKSTFLNAIENMLGKNNVSHVSLQKLESDKFAPARLYQKLANICADLPNTKLASTLVFKSITGGDSVEIEFKNKSAFSANLFSKLLFSTNELPKSADTSEGFYRKITIVPFEGDFKPNPTKGKELKAMITDPNELSGMLNNALEALPGVLANGIRISKSMKDAHEDYKESTDPMMEWIDTELEFNASYEVSKKELYDNYKEHCRMKNITPKSKDGFGKTFGKIKNEVKSKSNWIDNKAVRIWAGVQIKLGDFSNFGKL